MTAWFIIPITNTWFDLVTLLVIVFLFTRRYRALVGTRGKNIASDTRHAPPPSPVSRESRELSDAYKQLDLKPGASDKEIQNAYRELAKVWHPDRFASDAKLSARANRKLSEINQAYEKLRNRFRA